MNDEIFRQFKEELSKNRKAICTLVMDRLALNAGEVNGAVIDRRFAEILGLTHKTIEGVRILSKPSNLKVESLEIIKQKLKKEMGYRTQEIQELFLDVLSKDGWEMVSQFASIRGALTIRRKKKALSVFGGIEEFSRDAKISAENAQRIVSCELITDNLSVSGLSAARKRSLRVLTFMGVKDALRGVAG